MRFSLLDSSLVFVRSIFAEDNDRIIIILLSVQHVNAASRSTSQSNTISHND